MTHSEWYELTKRLVNSAPIEKKVAQRFLQQFRKSPRFQEQVKAQFGDRQIYNVDSTALYTFIAGFDSDIKVQISQKSITSPQRNRNNSAGWKPTY